MTVSKQGPVKRLRRLSSERRELLLRSAFLLGCASVAVAILPFRTAIRFGSVRLGESALAEADCIWAVEAAARRLPWRTMCIEKGLVVQRMLRRAGIDAVLHYGARHNPDSRKLEAHVWVMVADRAVIGGEEARGFAEIASYP